MKADTKKLLLLGTAGGLGYAIYRIHAARSSEGYYWAYVARETDAQKKAYDNWRKQNAGSVAVRKTIEPGIHNYWDVYFKDNRPSIWILFEAQKPFTWTLPGKPQPAPLGLDTDITTIQGQSEVLPAIESPEHPWNKFWQGFWSDGSDGKEPNPILTLWNSLGTAGPLLVYGATGIVLFKLWGAMTTGAAAARRALPKG